VARGRIVFKSKKRPESRLPADLGTMLEIFGREEFAPAADRFNLDPRLMTFADALSKLHFDPPSSDEASRLADEIREAALAQGGYALLGGCAAIDASLPTESDSSTYLAVQDAWLGFLRANRSTEVRRYLRVKDFSRYTELYGDDV
jgi:hypothetical protein